ncbi:MAG: metalloregulator ArsR/SmtB family transcription factor [Candidatus Pacebacteria bacterium]|nr:metalloregulator ArsR/SmtB family transcription factor [Candidatus Paceibacterota bacterium]MDD3919331.1 metalloregulator ArsR/SmtB family transcription factor [Candidatus Paceibacterota bacterium]
MKNIDKQIEILKIIAEENRLQILYLLKKGELCVCKIIESLKISQSLVSHHLKVLKKAGLVKDSKKGFWVFYSLTEKGERIINLKF